MKIIALFLTLSFSSTVFAKDCVVLLHGLSRTSHSMLPIKRVLEKNGYKVSNINYPSQTKSIEELSKVYIQKGVKSCGEYDSVHFVTHSMGGILVRYFMKHFEHPRGLGRVVMLAPPNKGSELVNAFKNVLGYDFWNGPAGRQLSDDEDSLPNRLGPVDFSLGVIAGNKKTTFLSSFIKGPNDGKVSVYSTKVEGMTDHVTVYSSHMFIMLNFDVKKKILSYLRQESFQ